jgi:hypothetical protein
MWNIVILSPPRRAKNLSSAFDWNLEAFFASARALRRMTKGLLPQTALPCRKRRKLMSHLRCSKFLWPPVPALPDWATFCRAPGALALPRPIRDLRIDMADLGFASDSS